MTDSRPFVHLHVHSEYSILDGAAKVDEIVQTAADMGCPAVAISDHGTMGSIADGYFAAKEAGIKFIPALEAYHVYGDRRSQEKGVKRYHTMLLAISNEGYRNLMHISGSAWRDGIYGSYPRIDDDLLKQHNEGIVMTSSCLSGMVARHLLDGNYDEAKAVAQKHIGIFGKDRYFIEIQNHGIPEQLDILDDQVRLAKELGVGLLATGDSHYVHEDQRESHEHMLCAQTGDRLSNEDRFKFDGDGHHIKSPEEMWGLFPEDEFPGACANTVKIAEMADFSMETNEYLIPQFPLEDGISSKEGLRSSAMEGVKRKYANRDGVVEQKVLDRLEYELGVIDSMGFNDYMLILSDAVKFCKRQGIGIGPGRGSGAGSLVVYAIDITDVDPISEGLFFERFLNPDRLSMPDIDIDVQSDRRDELHDYLAEKYGQDRVAYIGTYGVIKPKNAMRMSARMLGKNMSFQGHLSSLMPIEYVQGVCCTIRQALGSKRDLPKSPPTEDEPNPEPSPDLIRSWDSASDLRKEYRDNPEVRESVDIALGIEGYFSTRRNHAGAVVVTPTHVNDYFPTRVVDQHDRWNVIEFDMVMTEKLGGLKIDFLGLVNISTLAAVVRHVNTDLNKDLDLGRIPMDDPATFKMLGTGDLYGIFQFDTDAGHKMMKRLKPQRFDDIVAASALNRPGPMESNSHVKFAERRNGREAIEVAHPDLRSILNDTAGILTYQEQIMQIAQHYAGFSGAEADHLRKAMGKKDLSAMADMHRKFVDGMKEKGFNPKLGDALWNEMAPFAKYAFNKSHATAYSVISYWLAYLKTHYRPQFLAGHMDTVGATKYYGAVVNAKESGVDIYGPNINKSSELTFTNESAIWIGLAGVNGCSATSIRDILSERRRGGPFESVQDFFLRTSQFSSVRRKAISALTLAGAFDIFGVSRKKVFDSIDALLSDAANQIAADKASPGVDLFDLADQVESAMDSYVLTGDDYSKREKHAFEDEYLGFIVGDHPYSELAKLVPAAMDRGVIPNHALSPSDFMASNPEEGNSVTLYGVVTSLEHGKTRNGREFTSFILESADYTRIPCRIWGKSLPMRASGSYGLARGVVRFISSGKSDEEKMEVNVNDIDFLDDEDLTGERKTRGGLGVIDSKPRRAARRNRRSANSAPTPSTPSSPDSPNEIDETPTSKPIPFVGAPDNDENDGPLAVLYTIKKVDKDGLVDYLSEKRDDDGEDVALFRYPDSEDAELIPFKLSMGTLYAQNYSRAIDVQIVRR